MKRRTRRADIRADSPSSPCPLASALVIGLVATGMMAGGLALAASAEPPLDVDDEASPPSEARTEEAPGDDAQEFPAFVEPVVGGLRFEGNEFLSDSRLQAVTFTQGPSWKIWQDDPLFSESALIGDMARIRALYRQHGFYEAKAGYALVWNDEHNIVAITIEVEDGPSVIAQEIDLAIPAEADLDEPQRERLRADLPLLLGERFSPQLYGEARQMLIERMADLGYPAARIEGGATVDLATHEARIEWRIVPGPLVYFGEVTVSGLYLVKEATARQEVRIEAGQRYSTRALSRTRLGLQRQGLYSWVSVQARSEASDAVEGEAVVETLADTGADNAGANGEAAATDGAGATNGSTSGDAPDRAPAGPVIWPVEIRLTERSPYTVDMGIGYSTDESFRASVGWRNVNFLGSARKLRINGLYSGVLIKGQVEFIQPYFIDQKTSLIIRGSVRREDEPAYTANRILPSIGLSRPLFGRWRGRIDYDFSYQNVINTSDDADIILDEPEGLSRVGTVSVGLRRQTIDNLLDPHRGTWFDFEVAPSIHEFASDFDYISFLVEGRAYQPIGWAGVLGGRLRIGAIQPLRSTTPEQVPVVSRFFSGGGNSFRGFQYHRMPANGTDLTRVGGTSLLEASAEWRFPIWKKLGGVLFVDAGQIDLDPFRYPLDELFWAVGPGIRYDTIVGPLRFDFGTLLNPPEGTTRYQWFISVGQSF